MGFNKDYNAEDNDSVIWKDRKRTFLGLPWSFTKYRLTKDRFYIDAGFFTSKEDEVRLYRILDLSLKRTLGQKMLGLGTIEVHSSDRTLKCFEIKNIKQSKEVKKALSDAVEAEREAKRVVNREMMMDGDELEDMLDGDEND
ncbi:MAG: PH domain-containing protein [Lachnospiraceae bacterium]|nr:PH domain-containing protein [Lachnospiraceae bacterium]